MIDGVPVIGSAALPQYPSHTEDAKRIVRHGMADVLAWLGEEVGPRPGQPIDAMFLGDRLLVSQRLYDHLKERNL